MGQEAVTHPHLFGGEGRGVENSRGGCGLGGEVGVARVAAGVTRRRIGRRPLVSQIGTV